MSKRQRALLSCLMSVVAITAEAEPTTIYRLEPAPGSFQQVLLNRDIYRFSDDPGLQNLQVLDADQNPVPYRILPSEPEKSTLQNVPLAFFPVAADISPETLRQVYARVQLEGAKIELSTNANPTGKAPAFYLIDISKLEQPLTALRLNWDPDLQTQYLEVELEGSRNLQQWDSLGAGTLVNMGNQKLVRNRLAINLQPKAYDFLRLKIGRGGEGLQLNSIAGEPTQVKAPVPEEHWSIAAISKAQVASTAAPDSERKVAVWEFAREEVTPATAIKIVLGDNAYADDYALYSRSNAQQNWQLQGHGIWYSVRIGSTWETSEPIALPANSQKLWRLELAAKSAEFKPQLEFRWQPLRLQLIANDKPPFYLALNPETNATHRNAVFNQILAGRTPEWSSTQLEDLHQQPPKPPKASINWRTWLFWGTLILAVFVLLGFALRLLGQLNNQLAKSGLDDAK